MKPKRIKNPSLKRQVCVAGSIYRALISDIARGRPSSYVQSLMKDLSTIEIRLMEEGISFCTVTLPLLGKAMIDSFRTGKFECPEAFSKLPNSELPRFLSILLKDLYADDGSLLENFDISSCSEVNQICGLGYKLELPCTKAAESETIESFLAVENELRSNQEQIYWSSDPVIELCQTMAADVFGDYNREDLLVRYRSSFEHRPRHGPGSVATGERGLEKWVPGRNYFRLHRLFPTYEYFFVGQKHRLDMMKWYSNLDHLDYGTAKVTLVPKDSRGPRLISMEPLENQFIQQLLKAYLYDTLERHPFTRQHVNFADQRINQDLACLGSIDGSYATLDMSEASDRVTFSLVEAILWDCPQLFESLVACRSPQTQLPDGSVVQLWKFSPMGSAVCFPVESFVHFFLAVAAIMEEHEVSRWEACEAVFVYGDDLIIDTRYVKCVLECFPKFGLKFNLRKCFIHGPFRESCGMDALKGVDISPIRWRTPWPQRRTARSYQAFCDMASLFYQRGYLQVAETLWQIVESDLGCLPTVPLSRSNCLLPRSKRPERLTVQFPGYLARVTRFLKLHTPYRVRSCSKLQVLEHLALSSKPRKTGELYGWHRLFATLLMGPGAVNGVSDSPRLKNRWMRLL